MQHRSPLEKLDLLIVKVAALEQQVAIISKAQDELIELLKQEVEDDD